MIDMTNAGFRGVNDIHVLVILDLPIVVQGQADQTICDFGHLEHFGRVLLPHLEDDLGWCV